LTILQSNFFLFFFLIAVIVVMGTMTLAVVIEEILSVRFYVLQQLPILMSTTSLIAEASRRKRFPELMPSLCHWLLQLMVTV